MVFDSNKSVIIFSHPRSGSTWFQAGLPQFNLSELFNLNLLIKDYNQNSINYSFPAHRHDIDWDKELPERFKIFSYYTSNVGPVSVKIHLSQLKQPILNFIHKQNAQIIILERKNKLNAIYSYLIAWETLNWHGVVKPQDIIISDESLLSATKIFSTYNSDLEKIKSIFPKFIHLYYEDLIKENILPNWNRNNNYKIQQAKLNTTIINIDHVKKWLEKNNHFTEQPYDKI